MELMQYSLATFVLVRIVKNAMELQEYALFAMPAIIQTRMGNCC